MPRPSSDDISPPSPTADRGQAPHSRLGTIVLLGVGALVAIALGTSLIMGLGEVSP
jgi:hypothetical protein